MLEIGLSGLLLDYPHSGSAVYTRNLVPLLPAVAPDLRFCLFLRQAAFRAPGVTTRRLATPFATLNRGRGIGARLDKLAWEIVSLPFASGARRQALVHSLYFAAPAYAPAPLVVTVHDLIPFVLPGYHRGRQSALYSRFMSRTCQGAAAIITVSQHSKADIVRLLGIPETRVHVTYEGVDERFSPVGEPGESEDLRLKYGLPGRFVLYTGGAEKRKNLDVLVRAWARVEQEMRRSDVQMVIVANFPPPDHLYPDIPGLARDLGLERSVVFLPQVDEADKPALYRSALAFCFPSRYEGFGFTPLEAMASGVPVLASDAASLPEVVGDGGWLLRPDKTAAWAEAMLQVVASEHDRAALRARGLQRARLFCWRRTAEQTVEVYRQVLDR